MGKPLSKFTAVSVFTHDRTGHCDRSR